MSSGQHFVLFIVAISTLGWVVKTWLRARHGYPLDDERSGRDENIAAGRKVELLSDENGKLKSQVGRLEERIAVLERIVTDRSRTLSDEIDALR